MTFITQPTEEGETTKCENCDTDLIARWTDYQGKWTDKLQWQTIEPRKSHYNKENACKDTQIVLQDSTVATNSSEVFEAKTLSNNIHYDKDYLTFEQNRTIEKSSQYLWYIKERVLLTVKELEPIPNMGMIWEMTKIIYDELEEDKIDD